MHVSQSAFDYLHKLGPSKKLTFGAPALRLRDLLFAYSTMDNLEEDEMSLMRKKQSLFK